MAWRIEFDGHVLREADMTIGQAEQVETLTGTSWLRMTPYTSAKHAKALLAVMYAGRTGASYDDVVAKIEAIPVSAYLDMVKTDEEDDLPAEFTDGFPQSAGGTSTDS